MESLLKDTITDSFRVLYSLEKYFKQGKDPEIYGKVSEALHAIGVIKDKILQSASQTVAVHLDTLDDAAVRYTQS